MLRAVLTGLLLVTAAHAQYVRTARGKTCFMEGHQIISSGIAACHEAAVDLRLANSTAAYVDPAFTSISTGGCFYESGGMFEGLWYNSFTYSSALNALDESLCLQAPGKRFTSEYIRLNGSETCLSSGELTIVDEATCYAAAEALGISTSVKRVADAYGYASVAGCFFDLTRSEVYFNPKVISGISYVGASPICKKVGTASSVPATTSVGYVKLGGQSTCISWGAGVIQTAAECQSAALKLGITETIQTTPAEQWDSRPGGCYYDVWEGATGLYFNSFVSSQYTFVHSAPICENINYNYYSTFSQFPAASVCSNGYRQVSTMDECLSAARDLGYFYTYATETAGNIYDMHPGGCFVQQTTIGTSDKGLYFNPNPASSIPGPFDTPICALVMDNELYFRQDYGTSCNISGHGSVGTYDECKSAAKSLALGTDVFLTPSSLKWTMPRGCYVTVANGVTLVGFNSDPYTYAYTAAAAPICRKEAPLSFTVDASKQKNDFYFGANGWGQTELESKVLDKLPGRQGLRLLRWGNLIEKPVTSPPTGVSEAHGRASLSQFVREQYVGKECQLKEYSKMLTARGINVLAVPFGVAEAFTEKHTVSTYKAILMADSHIVDWAAYLAESIWFVSTQLEIPVQYVELTNEPNGVWDTYFSPTQYVTLVKETDKALRERGVTTTKIVGPGASDLGSALSCTKPLNIEEGLDNCYLDVLQNDPTTLSHIEAISMHPWDDVYNTENRSVSFLDEIFAKFNMRRNEFAANKDFIISEWGGLNLITMPLSGQIFNSTAADCYVDQTGFNSTKKDNNIAMSQLWAVRAFANLLILINNGVSDALYWMLHDNEWSNGCLGLHDRSGAPSVALQAFEPFFKNWPTRTARAVSRPWAGGVEGKTEDVVVAALTDGCRVLVGAANTKDVASTFTLRVTGMSTAATTVAVETYHNGGMVPEVKANADLQVTLASYGMLVFAIDEPSCSEASEYETADSAPADTTVQMLLLWGGLLVVGIIGASYTTKKSAEQSRNADYTMDHIVDPSLPNGHNSENNASSDAILREMPINDADDSPRETAKTVAIKRVLKVAVALDIIFHAVALTQAGTGNTGFTTFRADIRELGRLITDAWVYHAARIVVLCIMWRIQSTSVISISQMFAYIRPTYLAAVALLIAKARIRLGHTLDQFCWFDLEVQERSKPVSDMWFWTTVIIGFLFAAGELVLVWLVKKEYESLNKRGNAQLLRSKPGHAAGAKKASMDALSTLRFFAAIHIVIYHFNAEASKTWNIFTSWGASQLTFFFMLSGFVLSYQYGDRAIKQTDFWVKRAVRLYPLYVLSCVLGVLVMPSSAFDIKDTIFIFLAVQKWTGPAINYINTPGWAVGPFLLLYAIYPTMRDIVKTVSPQKRMNTLIPFCFFAAMMAAGDALNENWTGVFAPLNHIFLTAHFPSFLAGLALGLNFQEQLTQPEFLQVSLRDALAVPVCLTALGLLFCIVDLSDEHGDQPFWHEWARFGMLMPVYGTLIWYGGRGHDFVSKILSSEALVFLGKYSFTLYLMQAPLFNTLQKFFKMPYPTEDWACDAFVFILLAVCFLVCDHFEDPASKVLLNWWGKLYPAVPNFLNFVPSMPTFVVVIAYYATMIGIFAMFASLALFGTSTVLRWEGDSYMFDLTDSKEADVVITVIKWLALASLPVAVIGLTGQVFFPPCIKQKIPTLEQMLNSDLPNVPHFDHRLHFRIVTRGKAPLLVLENVETAARVLASCLPADKFEVEVVTDNDMQLQSRTTTPVTEIVVPASYKTPTGAKFKARALEYAIHNSSCSTDDWIVHQDEETRFDEETVRHVYYHCAMEQKAIADGKRRYGRIGQGIIYYGINDEIENWVTTLADSIRVADDFGKFRIQFALHEPLIGMHGSFVVASQAVEKATTFDHGMIGSVTEDAYFALVARSLGVTFSYIDARMYEQSPFSIIDFAKQRKRWFAGLWLVAKAPAIPLKYRFGLFLLEVQWGWAPFMLPSALLVLTCKTNTSVAFKLILALVSAYWCWSYVVGFLFTFSIKKLGVAKYFVLLWLQLVMQPLFALMEVWGVAWALVDQEAFRGFHVVDKQSASLKARMEGREPGTDTEMKAVVDGEASLLEKPVPTTSEAGRKDLAVAK